MQEKSLEICTSFSEQKCLGVLQDFNLKRITGRNQLSLGGLVNELTKKKEVKTVFPQRQISLENIIGGIKNKGTRRSRVVG